MNCWLPSLGLLIFLLLMIPWVARIRHPDQKPLTAYLIFCSVFSATAAFMMALILWMADHTALTAALNRPPVAAAVFAATALPAFLLGTWQARKPPLHRRPPD